MSVHSTATFNPTATTRRRASATASVRDPPPTLAEREKDLSRPERTCVPTTIFAPFARSVAAFSSENCQTPGSANPTTWVTTTSDKPEPFIAFSNSSADAPVVLATTIDRIPSSFARSTANRAASPVLAGPGLSK